MIKIIERRNGSMIFIGFYPSKFDKQEIEEFREAVSNLCVDAHHDRAIVLPEGSEVKTDMQD
jgi:hypothetical protein